MEGQTFHMSYVSIPCVGAEGVRRSPVIWFTGHYATTCLNPLRGGGRCAAGFRPTGRKCEEDPDVSIPCVGAEGVRQLAQLSDRLGLRHVSIPCVGAEGVRHASREKSTGSS